MAGHDKRKAILRAERAGCPRGAGTASERGQLAVADDLAPRDGEQRGSQLRLERRAPRKIERDVGIGRFLAAELPPNAVDEIRHKVGTDTRVFLG